MNSSCSFNVTESKRPGLGMGKTWAENLALLLGVM